MAEVLELQFESTDGKSFTISVDSPKTDLTVGQVYTAMQTIVQQDIFHKDGFNVTSIKGARVVERNVSNFEIPAN